MGLAGKVVVITGASSGIGKEIATACAQAGASPVLLARSQEKLQNAQKDIEHVTGCKPPYYLLDVTSQLEVERVFQKIAERTGRIDILVNNAGFGAFAPFTKTDGETVRAMFAVNVFGLMYCTKAVLPYMKRAGGGHIIQMASLAGKVPTPGSAVYSATKHAVLGFSDALRMELEKEGISVTTINPGPVRTAFFTKADSSGNYEEKVARWMMEPDSVARAVVRVLERPRREVCMPFPLRLGAWLWRLFPALCTRVARRWFYLKSR